MRVKVEVTTTLANDTVVPLDGPHVPASAVTPHAKVPVTDKAVAYARDKEVARRPQALGQSVN